jgi:AMP phosphorylase
VKFNAFQDAVGMSLNRNALNDIEMGAYVSTIYTEGLSMEETANLTQAMVDAGDQIDWDHEILADKHSIGGVPGNRVTPIIIPPGRDGRYGRGAV